MPRPSRLVLLGAPVTHSLSPRMQGAALAAAGIAASYEAIHVEPLALDALLDELRREGAAGNVTIPHKEAVAAACDELSPIARRVGAVNTFWCAGNRLVGDNTDVGGFDALARSTLGRDPEGLHVALIGAGGAAAAVLVAASDWPGCDVRLHARGGERARALVDRLAVGAVADNVEDAVADAHLVVNATPLGLRPSDPLPVDLSLLRGDAAVLDLVYHPGGTRWVREALESGRRAADGSGMLIEQGALAFYRWFGVEPDREAMWSAIT